MFKKKLVGENQNVWKLNTKNVTRNKGVGKTSRDFFGRVQSFIGGLKPISRPVFMGKKTGLKPVSRDHGKSFEGCNNS